MKVAIEFFNRPSQSHRHEIASELAVAAWEKVLKSYLHKAKHNIFHKDGKTKDFTTCRNAVRDYLYASHPEFDTTSENLAIIYEYRNNSAHFYGQHLDAILHGIFAECVSKFSHFTREHFKRELLNPGDAGILPVGFSRPIQPEDFLSVESASAKAPLEVKRFLKQLHDAGERLSNQGLTPEHSILISFRIALEDAKKAHRAQVVVAVDNSNPQEATLTVAKHVTLSGELKLTSDSKAPVVKLVEEDVWHYFNLTYDDIKKFMKESLPHAKLNDKFKSIMNNAQRDVNLCRTRLLNPSKPSGSKQNFYSDLIYQHLIERFPV